MIRNGVISTSLMLFASIVLAQNDQQELAKKSQNPIGNLISVPFENNTEFVGTVWQTAGRLQVAGVL